MKNKDQLFKQTFDKSSYYFHRARVIQINTFSLISFLLRMNSKKRNLSNRDEENEPSTSADCGSERSQRKKKCIPGSYLYQFNDDELSDEAGGDFSDSGSEWEASRSGIASYIDGGSKSDETVNSLKNSATISIPDARIAENSIGDINLERTVDNLSALANNTDSKISNNEKTVSKDANITKHGNYLIYLYVLLN